MEAARGYGGLDSLMREKLKHKTHDIRQCRRGERYMKTDKIRMAAGIFQNYTPGITKTERGIHICAIASGETCVLILYEAGRKTGRKFPFPAERRIGNVWSMDLEGEDFSGLEYTLEIDGAEIPDPYGREYTGCERWGARKDGKKAVRCRFVVEDYDWEGDVPLKRPYEETILYRIHPRGFTRHVSSQAEDRGTFKAIASKIPHMKDLGITALELMPPNEFNEIITEDGSDGNPYATGEPTGRLNYWGYAPGQYFAPKSSYASGSKKNPVREFKDLVKTLHKNGIEIIVELYFSGKESSSLVQEAVRFWVSEYHVDGVHLVGYAKAALLSEDPMLADTKLLAGFWESSGEAPARKDGGGRRRNLAEYNDGFMMDMRQFLKGNENQVNNLIFRSRRNPAAHGVIHYMAHTNGFTMADMVAYEKKRNEANGEENRDGSDYNYTWNCGAEGPTRKKKILQMRRKQLRNAYLLLLLSQGTPLILAGDEFGNSQGGNNNAYCQDNETSWLNWNQKKNNPELYEFVKYLIAFRKKHPVFRMKTEPKNIDYLSCGHPDVSYHGVKAWCPEFESFRRQLGIMYCGEYGQKPDGTPDNYFYVAYNMHWESHGFALPKLPKGMNWHLALNTNEEENNGIYPEGREPVLENQKEFPVPSRSIVVFIGL